MLDDTGNSGGGSYEPRERYYILDGQCPVAVNPLLWAVWFATHDRYVARTKHRGLFVSTVFLGIDSAHSGPPLLFETILFVGMHSRASSLECVRSHTWDEALLCHHKILHIARLLASGRGRAHCARLVRAKQDRYAQSP